MSAEMGSMIQKQTIFYVDDNKKSRLLLASILRQIGYEVIAVGDPLDAIEMLEVANFDLVLADYDMPTMNGAQLARAIKGIFPGVPIVMISGHAALPEEALLYVDQYCGKGATLDELVFSIHSLIAASNAATRRAGKGDSPQMWASST